MVFLESFKGVAKSFWCGSFRGALRVFQWCFQSVFKGVWSKLQRRFKAVSREFLECFKEVSGCFIKFQECCVSNNLLKCMETLKVLQRISMVFYRSFMGATRRFQWCFKSGSQVIKAIQGSFKGSFESVSRIFHKSFKEVSRTFFKCLIEVWSSCEGVSRMFCFWKFIIACHSSQLPEQKEGLFNSKSAFEHWTLTTLTTCSELCTPLFDLLSFFSFASPFFSLIKFILHSYTQIFCLFRSSSKIVNFQRTEGLQITIFGDIIV